jgi:hypothetical protein
MFSLNINYRFSPLWLLFTRWFKYDRDKLWLVYTQIVPVIFEPPCIFPVFLLLIYINNDIFVVSLQVHTQTPTWLLQFLSYYSLLHSTEAVFSNTNPQVRAGFQCVGSAFWVGLNIGTKIARHFGRICSCCIQDQWIWALSLVPYIDLTAGSVYESDQTAVTPAHHQLPELYKWSSINLKFIHLEDGKCTVCSVTQLRKISLSLDR